MNIFFKGPLDIASRQIFDADELKSAILSYPSKYWDEGSCGATLTARINAMEHAILLILPNFDQNDEAHGIYLKYILRKEGEISEKTWLSLGDTSALGQVTECGEEWYASVGLFLPPAMAWNAVEDFLTSGERSHRIRWIRPSELPPTGNW